MSEMEWPRLLAAESEIASELLSDPSFEVPKSLYARVAGLSQSDDWSDIAKEVLSLASSEDWRVAPTLYQRLRFNRRIAADPTVWRYATLFHFRWLAFERWGRSGPVPMERLMGSVRRNTVARLWWMVEAMQGDGVEDQEALQLALRGSERLKLWINDFSSFYGRPWLARSVVRYICVGGQSASDSRVDAVFRAIGRIANVVVLDRYQDNVEPILRMVDAELSATPR